jgi:Na+/proline symporter
MVAEQHLPGLYISVPIYFVLLGGCAYWAHRRMERMEHEHTADKLSAHYLGGKDFGPWMTAGTIFASLFSGYTVIGVPNEAYNTGWAALRWMSTIWGELLYCIFITLLMVL